MAKKDYVIRVLASPCDVDADAWNALLAAQTPHEAPSPFMRHEYLAAMHASGSAVAKTGWTPRFITLWLGDVLAGACALYLKSHSYGEYVFDWAWANAYAEHGLPYYPKALIAPPFTPVPGPRLLARSADERVLLLQATIAWCNEQKLSSLHLLFASEDDLAACAEAGLMLRHSVQFHWTNVAPTLPTSCGSLPPEGVAAPAVWQSQSRGSRSNEEPLASLGQGALVPPVVEGASDLLPLPPGEGGGFTLRLQKRLRASGQREEGRAQPGLRSARQGSPDPCPPASAFRDFDDFLMSLNQEKRKKIRQERRKVLDAGITFRWSLGADITDADWDFFYRCYERTYYEHGNAPYLSRDFFTRMQRSMPGNWLLFVAEHGSASGAPTAVAASLIAVSEPVHGAGPQERVAYGRYWGALARVDCLHFEACYYQPLQWCIAHGYQRFEGGAQGEHKMARALLPVKTSSAHWLAHPSFADAVERFLQREGAGIDGYLDELDKRSPRKQLPTPPGMV